MSKESNGLHETPDVTQIIRLLQLYLYIHFVLLCHIATGKKSSNSVIKKIIFVQRNLSQRFLTILAKMTFLEYNFSTWDLFVLQAKCDRCSPNKSSCFVPHTNKSHILRHYTRIIFIMQFKCYYLFYIFFRIFYLHCMSSTLWFYLCSEISSKCGIICCFTLHNINKNAKWNKNHVLHYTTLTRMPNGTRIMFYITQH